MPSLLQRAPARSRSRRRSRAYPPLPPLPLPSALCSRPTPAPAPQLAALGGEGGSKAKQAALVTQLINLIIANLQLGKPAIQLTGKLMQLAATNKASMLPADLKCLANTVAFIRLRALKSEKARVKSAQGMACQKLAIACKKLGL